MDALEIRRDSKRVEPDDLVTRLKALIESKGALPERSIASALGIKRHQVRRGLQALRESGDVGPPKPRRKPGGKGLDLGEIVRNTNPVQVLEMRCMIEPTLARIAAHRATPNQIDALRKAVIQIADGGKTPPSVDLHTMIAAASGNALAEEIYRLIRTIERDARLRSDVRLERDARDFEAHNAIVEAIAARDAEAAEEAMHQHLDALRSTMTGMR